MELDGISSNAALLGSVLNRAQASRETVEMPESRGKRSHGREHGHERSNHSHGHHRGKALGIFRQELKVAMSAIFRARFASSHPSYLNTSDGPSADTVAADTLGAAQRIVNESPTTASRALITLRETVKEAASYTRQTVSDQGSLADLENTVSQVEAGLDDIEATAARNIESSATFLAVDVESKQHSTIRIRTQEGDVVRFDLRTASSLSATDASVSSEGFAASSTQVEISSRSRMVLRVEGDLNEDELAAIQNVFARAEAMAEEFFGGDLAAAFDLAAGFVYDTEQLAKVNLGFKSREVSNIKYAELSTVASLPVSADPSAATTAQSIAPADQPGPDTGAAADVAAILTAAAVSSPEVSPQTENVNLPDVVLLDRTASSEFFELLSGFLRSVGEGFESNYAVDSASIKLHFSQSLKFEILKTVIQIVAPEGTEDTLATATATATALIDDAATAAEQAKLA